jgi:hypothetical protein
MTSSSDQQAALGHREHPARRQTMSNPPRCDGVRRLMLARPMLHSYTFASTRPKTPSPGAFPQARCRWQRAAQRRAAHAAPASAKLCILAAVIEGV